MAKTIFCHELRPIAPYTQGVGQYRCVDQETCCVTRALFGKAGLPVAVNQMLQRGAVLKWLR